MLKKETENKPLDSINTLKCVENKRALKKNILMTVKSKKTGASPYNLV